MLLRIKNDPTIKNLRNHSRETVEELQGLLRRGAKASLDPRRKNFYELDGGSRVFYIHLSPTSGKVMLLAVWENSAQHLPAHAHAAEFAAACCSSNG
jgi:hypothetical protein